MRAGQSDPAGENASSVSFVPQHEDGVDSLPPLIPSLCGFLPSAGAGADNGGRGSVLRSAPLHHRPEGQRDQEADGGIRG